MRISTIPGRARRCARLLAPATAAQVLVLACGDVTTAPAPREVTAAVAPTAALVSRTSAANVAVKDAIVRILPALGDESSVNGLRAALETLAAALADQDGAAAMAAIAGTERVLDVLPWSVTGEGAAADLDAIALALASARTGLTDPRP